MRKLAAFWNLFRAGKEVADPAKWKNRTITVNMLVAVLAAAVLVGKSFGLDLGVSDQDVQYIAGAVLAIFNIVMHVTTSKKVGLRPTGESAPEPSPFPDDNAGD